MRTAIRKDLSGQTLQRSALAKYMNSSTTGGAGESPAFLQLSGTDPVSLWLVLTNLQSKSTIRGSEAANILWRAAQTRTSLESWHKYLQVIRRLILL